jgi:hypothetical protein
LHPRAGEIAEGQNRRLVRDSAATLVRFAKINQQCIA